MVQSLSIVSLSSTLALVKKVLVTGKVIYSEPMHPVQAAKAFRAIVTL